MPEKDTGIWLTTLTYIQENYNAVAGFVMAFFMSILRAYLFQQNSSYKQRIIDGTICGALTLSSMSLLSYFGLSENLSTFIGGMAGFIGAENIREFLFKLINAKVNNKGNSNEQF